MYFYPIFWIDSVSSRSHKKNKKDHQNRTIINEITAISVLVKVLFLWTIVQAESPKIPKIGKNHTGRKISILRTIFSTDRICFHFATNTPILMNFFFFSSVKIIMTNEIQTHQNYENKSSLSNFPSSNPTP